MTRRAGAVAAVAVLALAGCGGSSPAPAPSPSAVPLRPIATCDAAVVVPPDTFGVTPTATTPKTSILSVGEALQFDVPRGARVGLLETPQGEVDAQLCAAAQPPSGSQVIVATGAGYVRIGIQVGVQEPAEVYVRVNE